MKQQKQPNPILESARRDSLREDGPARGQLLFIPSGVASCRITRKTGGKKKQSRHRALFIPKEGKQTRELKLERNGLTTRDCKVRESVTQGEGISTPTHPSYSTGSTLEKNRRKVARNCSQTAHKAGRKHRKRKKRDSPGYRILGLRSLSDTDIRVDVVRGQGRRAR